MVIDVLPLMLLLITPPLVLHSLPDPRALLPLILSFLLEPEFPWAMLGNVKGTGAPLAVGVLHTSGNEVGESSAPVGIAAPTT